MGGGRPISINMSPDPVVDLLSQMANSFQVSCFALPSVWYQFCKDLLLDMHYSYIIYPFISIVSNLVSVQIYSGIEEVFVNARHC